MPVAVAITPLLSPLGKGGDPLPYGRGSDFGGRDAEARSMPVAVLVGRWFRSTLGLPPRSRLGFGGVVSLALHALIFAT